VTAAPRTTTTKAATAAHRQRPRTTAKVPP
jgi:hypothetical protein